MVKKNLPSGGFSWEIPVDNVKNFWYGAGASPGFGGARQVDRGPGPAGG